jgi:hypothetical protein
MAANVKVMDLPLGDVARLGTGTDKLLVGVAGAEKRPPSFTVR